MTLVLVAAYLGGLALIRRTGENPMWEAVLTRATWVDQPAEDDDNPLRTRTLWLQLAFVGAAVAVGGWALAVAADGIAEATGLTDGFVGVVLLGVVNAVPETITAIAAVRRGALTLAIAAVLGATASTR